MFSDPAKNIKNVGLEPGMVVADFGAGSGHYTLAAARVVRDSGRVYAIDIQKDLATRIKNDAMHEHLLNVKVIWGDIEEPAGTKLGDKSVDVVILANILFQVEKKDAVLEEARRILKPGGKVLIVDWTDSFGGIGPRQKNVFGRGAAEALLIKHQFKKDSDTLSGQHHYCLVAVKE